MKKQQWLRVSLFTVLVLLQGTVLAKNMVAKVVSVIGAVDVIRSEDGTRQPLAFKSLIYLNDRIVTGVGSQAKFLLSDRSILKVGPSSELQVNEMVVNDNDDSKATIALLKGRLRSIIGRKLSDNSHYEVHTAVAVAGVRGTDFEVLVVSETETRVRSFDGSVAVTNLLSEISDSVLLVPDTFTIVGFAVAPQAPASIAPGENLDSVGGGSSSKSSSDNQSSEDSLQQAEAKQALDMEMNEAPAESEDEDAVKIDAPQTTAGSTLKSDVIDGVINDMILKEDYVDENADGSRKSGIIFLPTL